MDPAFHFITPPHECAYLPAETASLEYEGFTALRPAEYLARMQNGWRRFGHSVFRPQCAACRKCQSIRVEVAKFRPNRTQRRVRKLNAGTVRPRIGRPSSTPEKLGLH